MEWDSKYEVNMHGECYSVSAGEYDRCTRQRARHSQAMMKIVQQSVIILVLLPYCGRLACDAFLRRSLLEEQTGLHSSKDQMHRVRCVKETSVFVSPPPDLDAWLILPFLSSQSQTRSPQVSSAGNNPPS